MTAADQAVEGRSLAKAARIRKAPTIREQAEMARAEQQTASETQKRPGIGGRLPNFGVTALVAKVLRLLRWLVPVYLINSWRELRQVTWTNRRETWRLTFAVFIFAIVFGSLVAGVDKILDIIFKKFILHV